MTTAKKSSAATALELMEQKDLMELEIATLRQVLTGPGGYGLSGKLVDKDGFPFADVDKVVETRTNRNKLACLQNDHKQIMKDIELALQAALPPTSSVNNRSSAAHSKDAPRQNTTTTTTTTTATTATTATTTPQPVQVAFAIVDDVLAGSPAATAGILTGDRVVRFGSVSIRTAADSERDLVAAIPTVVRNSMNDDVTVVVKRGGANAIHALTLRPRAWSGRGSLGCKISPHHDTSASSSSSSSSSSSTTATSSPSSSPTPAIKQVTAVVFDLDGLLLETESLYASAAQEVIHRYVQAEYTWAIRKQVIGRDETLGAQIIVDAFQLPITAEEFKREREALMQDLFPTAKPMSGAVRLTTHLASHGVPVAVGTSSNKEGVALKLRNHGEWFKKVFGNPPNITTGCSVARGKPFPDIFLKAAGTLNVNPENVLVFEDAPSGVEAATAGGMQVVAVPDPEMDREQYAKATRVLSSLDDFRPEEWGLPPYES